MDSLASLVLGKCIVDERLKLISAETILTIKPFFPYYSILAAPASYSPRTHFVNTDTTAMADSANRNDGSDDDDDNSGDKG